MFFGSGVKAQVNLILNPSFEQLDSCTNPSSVINMATHWNFLGCSPVSLFNTCLTYTPNNGVPVHFLGGNQTYQYPRTGNGYCGMHNYTPPPVQFFTNYRLYAIGSLSSVLINGKSYCGKFYVNLDNKSPYKINQFGMYFDNGSIIGTQTTCTTVLNVTPQINNNPSVFLGDTLGWTKIEGVFIANGNENYITIGNFKTDIQTLGIPTGFNTTLTPAVYNIDDLSLIATDITAYAGNDVTICVSDSIHLGRPQEIGLECLWYKPTIATPFANTSDIWFKPTQTGVYTFVQRMDNCTITWDTVNVTVVQDCASLLPTQEIPNVFSPNSDGVNDVWEFTLPKGSTLSGVEVYDRWGLLIKNLDLQTQSYLIWDGRTTSGTECSAGVYYYTLEYTNILGEHKKLKGYLSLFR